MSESVIRGEDLLKQVNPRNYKLSIIAMNRLRFALKGKVVVDVEHLRSEITRKMEPRAGSLFTNHFEGGMIYAFLKLLGVDVAKDWTRYEDCTDWVYTIVMKSQTPEDAEKKLDAILKKEEMPVPEVNLDAL